MSIECCKKIQVEGYIYKLQINMKIFESAFYPYRMQYAADYGVSLMLLLSVGFLPSGFITYLIRERKNEEKQVQLVSGVTKMTYWMAAFIWDFMVNSKVSKN